MSYREYILSQGNSQVVLCELAGIKGWDPATRNLYDVAAVPLVHGLSHLPIIVDPSHATGRPDLIPPCALAGVRRPAPDGASRCMTVRKRPSPTGNRRCCRGVRGTGGTDPSTGGPVRPSDFAGTRSSVMRRPFVPVTGR
ncbi:MAG: hypothetical protein U0935_22930 [Pirellulales bacterium]